MSKQQRKQQGQQQNQRPKRKTTLTQSWRIGERVVEIPVNDMNHALTIMTEEIELWRKAGWGSRAEEVAVLKASVVDTNGLELFHYTLTVPCD